MDSMFDTLMGLPLFKGISHARMSKAVGAAKLHFLKYQSDDTIFQAGRICDSIAFIISGSVRIHTTNPDGSLVISQSLTAGDVIAPDYLFGKTTEYPGKVEALDTVSMLLISKTDYINILHSDNVFLFNYINLLSMNVQKSAEGLLAVSAGNIPERIAYWTSTLTQPRSFDISFECRGRDLAAIFNVPTSTLHAVLEDLKAKGIIDFTPVSISVRDRNALTSLLHNRTGYNN